jgi:hypothetical protein
MNQVFMALETRRYTGRGTVPVSSAGTDAGTFPAVPTCRMRLPDAPNGFEMDANLSLLIRGEEYDIPCGFLRVRGGPAITICENGKNQWKSLRRGRMRYRGIGAARGDRGGAGRGAGASNPLLYGELVRSGHALQPAIGARARAIWSGAGRARGEMAKAADRACIQYRCLNAARGRVNSLARRPTGAATRRL